MNFDNFVATTNFFSKASRNNARCVSTRRAFFVSESQVIDDNLLSAACLKWYLSYPHFNFSLCDGLVVGGEEGSRFFCSQLTTNPMQKSNPQAQTALNASVHLLHAELHPSVCDDKARRLLRVCRAAALDPNVDPEDLFAVLTLVEVLYEVALRQAAI